MHVARAWRLFAPLTPALKCFFAVGLVGLVLAQGLFAAEPMHTYYPYTRPTLIAHRGASGLAPEHTRAAYELALKYGADFVEPDLQLTRDGVLICLHDSTLERTTNVAAKFPHRSVETNGKKTWPAANFTWEEIQQLDAGSWRGPQFAGERVPSLQQMIDLVRGKAGIIPETKTTAGSAAPAASMERALMQLLATNKLSERGADPKTPVVIQSFSEQSLRALREQLHCQLPLIYLLDAPECSREQLSAIKKFADGVAPAKAMFEHRPALVRDAHDLGLSVTAWTFRAGKSGKFSSVGEEMSHFLTALAVDALFTDNPEQFPRP